MNWLKRKLRRWMNSDIEISMQADSPYATPHNNMGDATMNVQMFKAMNGSVLVLHSQATLSSKSLMPRQSGPTIYVLKDGESVQDAVATLLVKARLDSM